MSLDERPLVILDLDNTCISAVEMDELHQVPKPDQFRSEDLEDVYRIYQRPGLQEWLTELFQHYKVAVWTAAGLSYGLFVIKKFIIDNKPERQLEFFMWDDHCDYSSRRSKGQAKKLSLLEPLFSLKTMVLVDDNKDVLKQRDTVNSRYFEVTHKDAHKDNFLTNGTASQEIKDHFDTKSQTKILLRDEIRRRLEDK